MTRERLTELSCILSQIDKYQTAIEEIEAHQFIAIEGYIFGESVKDYIADTSDRCFDGLEECVLNFMKSRLEILEKMFEEA